MVREEGYKNDSTLKFFKVDDLPTTSDPEIMTMKQKLSSLGGVTDASVSWTGRETVPGRQISMPQS